MNKTTIISLHSELILSITANLRFGRLGEILCRCEEIKQKHQCKDAVGISNLYAEKTYRNVVQDFL